MVLEEKGKKLQRGQRGLECADGSGGLVDPGMKMERPSGDW